MDSLDIDKNSSNQNLNSILYDNKNIEKYSIDLNKSY